MPQSNLLNTDTEYWFSFLFLVKTSLGLSSLLSLISGEVLRNSAITKLKVSKQASAFLELLLCAKASLYVTAFFVFWVRGTGDGLQQTGVYVRLCHVLANWSHLQPQFAHQCKGVTLLDSPGKVAKRVSESTPARGRATGYSAGTENGLGKRQLAINNSGRLASCYCSGREVIFTARKLPR